MLTNDDDDYRMTEFICIDNARGPSVTFEARQNETETPTDIFPAIQIVSNKNAVGRGRIDRPLYQYFSSMIVNANIHDSDLRIRSR